MTCSDPSRPTCQQCGCACNLPDYQPASPHALTPTSLCSQVCVSSWEAMEALMGNIWGVVPRRQLPPDFPKLWRKAGVSHVFALAPLPPAEVR